MLFNLTSYFGLDSSNECVKEDGIIIEESDDNGDQVGQIQVTEAAQIHSGARHAAQYLQRFTWWAREIASEFVQES